MNNGPASRKGFINLEKAQSTSPPVMGPSSTGGASTGGMSASVVVLVVLILNVIAGSLAGGVGRRLVAAPTRYSGSVVRTCPFRRRLFRLNAPTNLYSRGACWACDMMRWEERLFRKERGYDCGEGGAFVLCNKMRGTEYMTVYRTWWLVSVAHLSCYHCG